MLHQIDFFKKRIGNHARNARFVGQIPTLPRQIPHPHTYEQSYRKRTPNVNHGEFKMEAHSPSDHHSNMLSFSSTTHSSSNVSTSTRPSYSVETSTSVSSQHSQHSQNPDVSVSSYNAYGRPRPARIIHSSDQTSGGALQSAQHSALSISAAVPAHKTQFLSLQQISLISPSVASEASSQPRVNSTSAPNWKFATPNNTNPQGTRSWNNARVHQFNASRGITSYNPKSVPHVNTAQSKPPTGISSVLMPNQQPNRYVG